MTSEHFSEIMSQADVQKLFQILLLSCAACTQNDTYPLLGEPVVYKGTADKNTDL